MHTARAPFIALWVLLLSGCGQTGPLVLPPAEPAPTQTAPAPQPATEQPGQ